MFVVLQLVATLRSCGLIDLYNVYNVYKVYKVYKVGQLLDNRSIQIENPHAITPTDWPPGGALGPFSGPWLASRKGAVSTVGAGGAIIVSKEDTASIINPPLPRPQSPHPSSEKFRPGPARWRPTNVSVSLY